MITGTHECGVLILISTNVGLKLVSHRLAYKKAGSTEPAK